MAMFGFKSKKDEVLNHWIAFVESFSFSPQEFFGAVEKELAARKIPGLDMSRVDYSEGGLLQNTFTIAKLAGMAALLVCAFGTALVLLGAPLYFLLRRPGNRQTD